MAYDIPDESLAAHGEQATLFSTDVDALVQGFNREGVISGCAVTAQTPAAMAVDVALGVIRIGGSDVDVAAGSVNITAADATRMRIDIIVVNNAGTKSAVDGTWDATDNPLMPAIPANSVLLAGVFVPAAATTITSDEVIDKRVFLGSLQEGDIPAAIMRDAEHTAIGDGAPHHAPESGESATHTHDARYHTETEHGGVSPQGHHAEAHTLASHTTKAHSELSDAPEDAHHAKVHGLAEHNTGSARISVGLDADKPAAATADRLYYATDIKILYRDTGVAWEEIARGEAAARLAQLAEKAHASLTGVTADQHHAETHSAEHQHGGSQEVATATPAANVIPKAGADSKLASGFHPVIASGDLHTEYQKESEKGAANGYAGLDAGGDVPDAQIPAGVTRDSEHGDFTPQGHAALIEHADISPAEGFMRKTGAGAYTAHKSNLSAAAAPTVNDDGTAGYSVGSRWIDTTNDKEYVCLDITTGAAVWTETTGAGGGGGAIDIQEGSASIVGAATAINFAAADFVVTDEGGNVAGIAIDYPNSKIARKNQAETITGAWTFQNSVIINPGTLSVTKTGAVGVYLANFVNYMSGGVGTAIGVGGQDILFGTTTFDRKAKGLFFRVVDMQQGGGGTITEFYAAEIQFQFSTADTHTIDEMIALYANLNGTPSLANVTITAAYGIKLDDLSLSQMTTYTGIDLPNSSNAGTNYLMRLGPATRYFQVDGGAAPGAGASKCHINIGGSLLAITAGAADSGGAGLRALCVPN